MTENGEISLTFKLQSGTTTDQNPLTTDAPQSQPPHPAPHKSSNFHPLLIQTRPSFLTANRPLYTRHTTLEILNPTHDSPLRKSSVTVAVLNLVATVCGGGVLSLPLAFSVAGIIPTTLMMLIAALITDYSLYILCACARRTGGKSYADVARAAFGTGAEVATTMILFWLLAFILVAYMVLVKDFWTPIVVYVVPGAKQFFMRMSGGSGDEDDVVKVAGPYVLALILVAISPLLLKRDLHALRHTCYVGMVSLVLLSMGLFYRSWDENHNALLSNSGDGDSNPILQKPHHQIKWYSTNIWDSIYAFPIVGLSFLSSFNVLGVHGALVDPTRRRMKSVLDMSILICFVFFYIVGVCGYMYAYDDTKDNIILNFELNDRVIILGRLGYAATLGCGMPLVLLPCRESLLTQWDQLLAFLRSRRKDHESPEASSSPGPHIVNGINFDEDRPLLHTSSLPSYGDKGYWTQDSFMQSFCDSPVPTKFLPPRNTAAPTSTTTTPATLATTCSTMTKIQHQPKETPPLRPATMGDYVLHTVSTFGLALVCYITAVAVPGVGIVWSICGSFMAIIVAFFIPCACYLKIRARKGWTTRSRNVFCLMVFSIVACLVCTYQSVVAIITSS